MDTSLKTTVYRIFQECLTNIARHARATQVKVALEIEKDILKMVIKDNGRGITSKEINASQSLGLLGMQERARQKGGKMEISGDSNQGTSIISTFPIQTSMVK